MGSLLDGVDEAGTAVLDDDEDEGRLYFRRPVTVQVGDDTVACETYVGNLAVIPGCWR